MDTEKLLNYITPPGGWKKTGSTVICNPPPTDTDIDYIAWTGKPCGFEVAMEYLSAEGFTPDTNEHYKNLSEYEFVSFKRERDNIILTRHKPFFDRHNLATSVCKQLNLLSKADRIMIFQAILYGNFQPPLPELKEATDDTPW